MAGKNRLNSIFVPNFQMENTSTSSAHSATPWYLSTRGTMAYRYGEQLEFYICNKQFDVAVIPMASGRSANSDQAKANARLFVAAPDLLEACKTQLENWRMFLSGEWDGSAAGVQLAMENLTAVIAKAEGRIAPHSEE